MKKQTEDTLDLQIRRVENGFIITSGYSAFARGGVGLMWVAVNKEHLDDVLDNLLDPLGTPE